MVSGAAASSRTTWPAGLREAPAEVPTLALAPVRDFFVSVAGNPCILLLHVAMIYIGLTKYRYVYIHVHR